VPAQPSALNLATSPVVVVPNQTGLGYETGFKFDAMEHRFSATLALYEITLKNVQVSEVDPRDPTNIITTFDGGQKSRGVELDANWQISDKFTWLGSYSYTHSRPTDRGIDLDVMSRQYLRIPYHQGSTTVTYQVFEPLRVYLSMRYMSQAFVDTAGAFVDSATNLNLTNNGQRLIHSPSYAIWNIGAAYRFKSAGRLKHSINLTAKNLFDKSYVQTNRYAGDRFGVYASYSVSH
jgi:outer membrane receptor protein involved in Fe transport